jgi:hypothetical protein
MLPASFPINVCRTKAKDHHRHRGIAGFYSRKNIIGDFMVEKKDISGTFYKNI